MAAALNKVVSITSCSLLEQTTERGARWSRRLRCPNVRALQPCHESVSFDGTGIIKSADQTVDAIGNGTGADDSAFAPGVCLSLLAGQTCDIMNFQKSSASLSQREGRK